MPPRSQKASRARKPRGELALAGSWRRWIARALVGRAKPGEVLEGLREEKVDEPLALREIVTIDEALEEIGREHRRLALALRLVASHTPAAIDRRRDLTAAELHDRHFTALRPVVLTHAFEATAARRWTFASLRERFGHATVRVSVGRLADPRHYVQPETTYREMELAAVIDQALGPPTNDIYIVSRNRVLEDALAPLLADLAPLPAFLASPAPARGTSLWLGPAGTVTPLHHDTSHIVLLQLVGTKRITLVPPWDRAVLLGAIHDTFYSDVDPADALTFELGPGEALYLPVGWWHRVVALEPSITVSFTAFAWPSEHDWYRPGEA